MLIKGHGSNVSNCTYNVDRLVVLAVLVGLEVVLECRRVVRNVRALGRVEVVNHALVEWEETGRSANFCTHVANRSHTCARERFDTRSVVLNNSACATLHSQDSSDLEDDICICTSTF